MRAPISPPLARAARAIAFVGFVALLAATRPSRAEDVAVPASLEAGLLAKVAGYDKNLRARAGDRVRVLLVERHDDDD